MCHPLFFKKETTRKYVNYIKQDQAAEKIKQGGRQTELSWNHKYQGQGKAPRRGRGQDTDQKEARDSDPAKD